MDSTAQLLRACEASHEYPANVICSRIRTHTLKALRTQLAKRQNDLFGATAGNGIDFLELRRLDEGCQSFKFFDCATMRRHLDMPLKTNRADPHRRFIFIKAAHSRAALDTTADMFKFLMSYLQVMPYFLEQIFPFGYQHHPRDFHFGSIHLENRLTSAERGLNIKRLDRSGRHIELCYSLKSVEISSSTDNPWSIRQASVYHRHDLDTDQMIWIVVKANSLIQNEIQARMRDDNSGQPCSLDSTHRGLVTSADIHALLASWAGENWQWYIGDLEDSFQQLTRTLLTSSSAPIVAEPPQHVPLYTMDFTQETKRQRSWSTLSNFTIKRTFSWLKPERNHDSEQMAQPTRSDNVTVVRAMDNFSFDDLPRVQHLQEKVSEATFAISANYKILEKLRLSLLASAQVVEDDALHSAMAPSVLEIIDVQERLATQRGRAESLSSMILERKSLLTSIIQHKSMMASELAAKKAQASTDKMEVLTQGMHEIARKTEAETVSMRIITLVTLFFLPGTFISTLMSTPIVNFDDDASSFSVSNIGVGALELYLLVSLPLMLLTFVAWYVVYFRERRRAQAQMFKESIA